MTDNMGVKAQIKGEVPTGVWDLQASKDLAPIVAKALDQRAFVRGHDVTDAAFAPYTPEYAEKKKAEGDAGGGKPDLQASGSLRSALAQGVKVTEEGVTLTVPSSHSAQAEGLSKKRRFWGVSPADEKAIQAAIEKIVVAAMKRSEAKGGKKS